MMDEIQELEQKLNQAKKKEKINILMKQISNYKGMYLDKCYSSKTLTKNTSRVDAYAIHIYDVVPNIHECTYNNKSIDEIDLNEVDFNEYDISLKFESINYIYNPKENHINLSTLRSTMSTKYLNIPKYEITLEHFNNIVKTVQSRAMKGGTLLLEELSNWDLIYSGSCSDETQKVKLLERLDFKFVELKSMELIEELSFHPFLYNKYLMISPLSYRIIKSRLDYNVKELSKWRGQPYSDNMISIFSRRIKLLETALKLVE